MPTDVSDADDIRMLAILVVATGLKMESPVRLAGLADTAAICVGARMTVEESRAFARLVGEVN
jgi:hypothetical protein